MKNRHGVVVSYEESEIQLESLLALFLVFKPKVKTISPDRSGLVLPPTLGNGKKHYEQTS